MNSLQMCTCDVTNGDGRREEEGREIKTKTEHLLLTIRQHYDTFYQIWHDYFCALCNEFTAVQTREMGNVRTQP